jgi:hypothetical protein
MHIGQQVGIGIQGDEDRGVSQNLLGDLRWRVQNPRDPPSQPLLLRWGRLSGFHSKNYGNPFLEAILERPKQAPFLIMRSRLPRGARRDQYAESYAGSKGGNTGARLK